MYTIIILLWSKPAVYLKLCINMLKQWSTTMWHC